VELNVVAAKTSIDVLFMEIVKAKLELKFRTKIGKKKTAQKQR